MSVIFSRALWENAKTERHGGFGKQMFDNMNGKVDGIEPCAASCLVAQTLMLQASDAAALGRAARGRSRAPRFDFRDGDVVVL